MSKRLEGKVAIITGGTSGIGKGTVKLFAEEGAKVVFCGRREAMGLEVERDISVAGGTATYIKADITSDEDMENLVNKTMELYGKIDILIANAGVHYNSKFEDAGYMDAFDKTMLANFRAQVKLIHLVVPHMLKAGKGSVCVTGSCMSIMQVSTSSPYSVSKAALSQLIRSLAIEYGEKNIRFNAVCPGPTYSEMLPKNDPATEPVLEKYRKLVPLRRIADEKEQASAHLFLSSDEAAYITGVCLMVDGGFSLKSSWYW